MILCGNIFYYFSYLYSYCIFSLSSDSELQADLVQVLREALVHPSTGVRMSTAPLLEVRKDTLTS